MLSGGVKMDLTLKLADVPDKLKKSYLRKKLRELQLVNRVDKITDRCKTLIPLANSTLKLARRFFKCDFAALLFTDREARHRQFYLA